RLMLNFLDSLKSVENIEIALRVFGHQYNYPPPNCSDTRLEIPFAPDNINLIKNKIRNLVPRGTTPIAHSLLEAANDFPPCDNCRNIVILITDGIEECDGDPCAVSQALQRKGVFLRPFVIGIGRDVRASFECVGEYFDASDEHAFNASLKEVISRALGKSTLTVNLLDTFGNPTETNVNMTFFHRETGQVLKNFIHTLNHKKLPDTLWLDPLIPYRLVVHTTPPVGIDSIVFEPQKHNTVTLNAPQGSLLLSVTGSDRLLRSIPVIVKQSQNPEILYVQTIGEQKRYLTGLYDIEVLSLPRIKMPNIAITQSEITKVEIPQPGIAVINKSVSGFGSLYMITEEDFVWVCDLRDSLLNETLVLLPGSYVIVFRSRMSERSIFTIERRFSIKPGETLNVRIF
ncbi:MAG TPA: hypothetical protein VLH16_00970, partial [Bacteroidales bacterium]|nr:hypothetical protein [Bacteroidales bacterium]